MVQSQFDFALMHDVLWDMEGQGGEMRTLGLTEDATILLSSTENAQSQAIHKRHQERCLRRASTIMSQFHAICNVNSH